jgi:hypothetical protein
VVLFCKPDVIRAEESIRFGQPQGGKEKYFPQEWSASFRYSATSPVQAGADLIKIQSSEVDYFLGFFITAHISCFSQDYSEGDQTDTPDGKQMLGIFYFA